MSGEGRSRKARALGFVLLVGVMSLFADFTYEGARSVVGPFLATLGASGTIVGVVTGFGEFAGYALRLFSGRAADRTRLYWTITFSGYLVQMLAVPALALAGNWPVAAVLLILERAGRATRNPPRDVMLSHAGKEMNGYGWTFGLHEALDQLGALIGPLVVALVLARRGDYRTAFAILAVPAGLTLLLLTVARITYPNPGELEAHPAQLHRRGLPRSFWIYLAGAALVGAGFVDFPLVAFHLGKTARGSASAIPILYAVAMGTGGLGSLVFGKWFDRAGIGVLVPLTIVSAAATPLMFLGSFWPVAVGAGIWGLGMGVHESIVPAAVARMVHPDRRASAYGLFTAGYGLFWFLGSALMGVLYDVSVPSLVAVSIGLELVSLPFFIAVARRAKPGEAATR